MYSTIAEPTVLYGSISGVDPGEIQTRCIFGPNCTEDTAVGQRSAPHDRWLAATQVTTATTVVERMHYGADDLVFNDDPQLQLVDYFGTGTVDPSPTDSYHDHESSHVAPSPSQQGCADPSSRLRCWEHGCNGREFSSRSNLNRHVKEKEGKSEKAVCPLCGAIFTRTSTRDTHVVNRSCNRIRRYSNGRERPSKVALMHTFVGMSLE